MTERIWEAPPEVAQAAQEYRRDASFGSQEIIREFGTLGGSVILSHILQEVITTFAASMRFVVDANSGLRPTEVAAAATGRDELAACLMQVMVGASWARGQVPDALQACQSAFEIADELIAAGKIDVVEGVACRCEKCVAERKAATN